MATSGTNTFNLEIDEIIEEAISQIGGEVTLGDDPREARRSLDLLLREWQNRGMSLWKTDVTSFTASTTVANTTLLTNVIDVTMATVRNTTTNIDTQMYRITMEEYETLANKAQTGKPIQYAIQHTTAGPVMYIWPLADTASLYDIRYRYFGYHEDSSKSTLNADVPTRMLPALTSGLAYKMAIKRPGVTLERVALLKQVYDEVFNEAFYADRNRASLFIRPKL
jgi:hypothetical protein